jgi:hypothetical protein
MLLGMEMMLHGLLIKLRSLALLYGYSILRALAQTGSQAITVYLGNQLGLAVYYLKCSLGTTRYTGTASIALFLIYLYYFAHNLRTHITSSFNKS